MSARKVLFSAQRNEGPFILEWVAYHRVIGFTDIVVYSNDCDDGSDDLLDRLAGAGEVEHVRHNPPEGIAPQQNASLLAQEAGTFRDGDWVMWLDLDEYLVPNVGDQTLDALIAEIGEVDALLVAWRHFGDGGNQTWPGRQISPAFTGARAHSDDLMPYVKTLFRWSDKIEHLDIHRPYIVEGETFRTFRALTSTGAPARRRFVKSRQDRFNRIIDPGDWWKLAQVNHYTLRTPDVFEAKKLRGRGNRPAAPVNDRHTGRYYRKHNYNEVDDRRILTHLAPLETELARLAAIVGAPPA